MPAGRTERLITGSADQTAKLWDAETGALLETFAFESPARAVDFSEGDKQVLISTDPFLGAASAIHVKTIDDSKYLDCSFDFIRRVHLYLEILVTSAHMADSDTELSCLCRCANIQDQTSHR